MTPNQPKLQLLDKKVRDGVELYSMPPLEEVKNRIRAYIVASEDPENIEWYPEILQGIEGDQSSTYAHALGRNLAQTHEKVGRMYGNTRRDQGSE